MGCSLQNIAPHSALTISVIVSGCAKQPLASEANHRRHEHFASGFLLLLLVFLLSMACGPGFSAADSRKVQKTRSSILPPAEMLGERHKCTECRMRFEK